MYGGMLKVLRNAENLLRDADCMLLYKPGAWESLDVDHEPPRVERLWRQCGVYRIMLHRIHPCERALFHPHPWPSAVKVLSGAYEMAVGYGAGSDNPPIAATTVLTAGSSYEMIDPNAWHLVRPLGAPSLSLMVVGLSWMEHHPGEKRPSTELKPLSPDGVAGLLAAFRGVLL